MGRALLPGKHRTRRAKPMVARFGRLPLKRRNNAVPTDRNPAPAVTRTKEPITRLLAGSREMRGHMSTTQGAQIRKLADLGRPGQPQPACGTTAPQDARPLHRMPRAGREPCPNVKGTNPRPSRRRG